MAVLLLATGCNRSQGPADPAVFPDPSIASRVMVLDADSYVIDGRHIKLAGGVAPQSIPAARCWAESLASKFAIQRTKQIFAGAHKMEVIPTGEVDTARRHTARIMLDNQNLTDILYNEGIVAKPEDGKFSWCSPISEERQGAPLFSSHFEPGRSYQGG